MNTKKAARSFRLASLAGLALSSLSLASGATVTLNAYDQSGTASFNTAGNWSNGQAPTAGNAYLDSNEGDIRTPSSGTSYTFAGDSLEFSGAAELYYKGPSGGTITINNLILNNGGAVDNESSPFTLAGNITLSGTGGGINPFFGNITVTANISGTGALTDSSSNTSTLSLSGANTYSGGTMLSYGTLDAATAGSLGFGNVTVASTTTLFELDSASALSSGASLILASGMTNDSVDLNFTGIENIFALSENGGTSDLALGTYGAVGSGAQYTSSIFEGNGVLDVVAPEPSTLGLMGLGFAGVIFLVRRRRAAL